MDNESLDIFSKKLEELSLSQEKKDLILEYDFLIDENDPKSVKLIREFESNLDDEFREQFRNALPDNTYFLKSIPTQGFDDGYVQPGPGTSPGPGHGEGYKDLAELWGDKKPVPLQDGATYTKENAISLYSIKGNRLKTIKLCLSPHKGSAFEVPLNNKLPFIWPGSEKNPWTGQRAWEPKKVIDSDEVIITVQVRKGPVVLRLFQSNPNKSGDCRWILYTQEYTRDGETNKDTTGTIEVQTGESTRIVVPNKNQGSGRPKWVLTTMAGLEKIGGIEKYPEEIDFKIDGNMFDPDYS